MSIEAMKRVIDAWDTSVLPKNHDGRLWQMVEEMRQAIAEAEKQEPVAIAEGSQLFWISGHQPTDEDTDQFLYFAPPQRQHEPCPYVVSTKEGTHHCALSHREPLTDEEIHELMPAADGSAEADVVRFEVSPGLWGKEYTEVDAWSRPLIIQITRAIEAAHGIKGIT